MVLFITWCMTDTVFSQAACGTQKWRWITAAQLEPTSCLEPPWDSDLQVFGVMVSPGQQQGGKQVPRAHKHSVHFGNVHADFMTGNCPIWIYYNEEKQVNKPLKNYNLTTGLELRLFGYR